MPVSRTNKIPASTLRFGSGLATMAAMLEQDTDAPRNAIERDRREGHELGTNHARACGIVARIDEQRSASRT